MITHRPKHAFTHLSTAFLWIASSWSHHTHSISPTLSQSQYGDMSTVHKHSRPSHCRCHPQVWGCSCRRPRGCIPPLYTHSVDPVAQGYTCTPHTHRCRCLGCSRGCPPERGSHRSNHRQSLPSPPEHPWSPSAWSWKSVSSPLGSLLTEPRC